jgi:hypothetical protein
LTWSEGSAGADVPTPSAQWILVSFRDSQPPLLMAMLSGPESFELKGKPGAWQLMSASKYEGWIRFSAPLGLTPLATNSAAALGSLKVRVAPLLKYLTGPVPKLLKVETIEQEGGLTANWTFDRPYALVPIPVVLASLGGYPLKLESNSFRIDSTDPSGPLSVLTEDVMRLRFPVRRIPTGRALALGAPKLEPLATVSTIDMPSICELAFSNLTANRDALVKETSDDVLGRYLSDVAYSVEPNTNQRLPYDGNGVGLDVAAAQAFLMQSTISTVKATSDPNSLLTSVMWRRDWRTWTIWSPTEGRSSRAGALAALAAALCPEPERRLDAGMLEAGLSAREGLRVWRTRTGMDPGPKPSGAPYEGFRHALFGYSSKPEADEAYLKFLLSEIRVYGDHAIDADTRDKQIVLGWEADSNRPTTIILASAYPIETFPGTNLAVANAEDALGFTVLRCTPHTKGRCEIKVRVPDWAAPLPKYVDPPRY